MQPERGDVVRSTDPFTIGEDSQRPWLIVDNESHPFDEQFVGIAISTEGEDAIRSSQTASGSTLSGSSPHSSTSASV